LLPSVVTSPARTHGGDRCVMRYASSIPTVAPMVLDARPEYLRAAPESASLLTMPLGASTIAHAVSETLAPLAHGPIAVLPLFRHASTYAAALAAANGTVPLHLTTTEEYLTSFEPSDRLLLLDPRWWPIDADAIEHLLRDARDEPMVARHLCVLEGSEAGTRERVEYDAAGRVRRIRRYYESNTWTVGAGVACSVVPVACLEATPRFVWASLAHLRSTLSERGVPTRDSVLRQRVLNLDLESDFLHLNERAVLAGGGCADARALVSASARLLGPVVIHPLAQVHAGATVVGPTVIGPRAVVGEDATIAQCIVGPDVAVREGSITRHRAICSTTEGVRTTPLHTAGVSWHHAALGLLPTAPGDGRRYATLVKPALDSIFAFMTLVVTAPVLCAIALLIKLDSRGPVLYAHIREGKGGRPFRCYKFRTMAVGADAHQRELYAQNQVDGPQFKLDHDPRVTRVGRWLRATSLDELPQFVNVLAGHMSVVGPRPSPFRENQLCVPWRDARLSLKPGITGLWQVCRHDRGQGDFHQWIYYDLIYVREMSLAVDARIVVATITTGGGHTPAPLSRIVPGARKEGAA
jgi:YD repeat-containing protein